MPRRNNRRRKPAQVFLNLPYDPKFEPLYLAYIVGISALGLVPRATLELPAHARLDRIMRLITSCELSIHDLSRVQLDRSKPCTPRFNMPFELGLAVAHQRIHKHHKWFVFEERDRRVMKSLSDLNGIDVYIHSGTVEGVFSEICNAFIRETVKPTVPQMWRIYRQLRRAVPTVLKSTGSRTLFQARPFKDLSTLASEIADREILGVSNS